MTMTSTSDPLELHRSPSRALSTLNMRRPVSTTIFSRLKRSSATGLEDASLAKRVGIEKEPMSEASLVDREWEEVDWERVKTLPMVCLIPPEEDEVGPVTLYPLLPPLPPHPAPATGPSTSRSSSPCPTSVWGGMANGFVRPPPVFSRSSHAVVRGVVMPKTKGEVVAARSRRLAREMIEGTMSTMDELADVTIMLGSGATEERGTTQNKNVGTGMLSTDPTPGATKEDRLPPIRRDTSEAQEPVSPVAEKQLFDQEPQILHPTTPQCEALVIIPDHIDSSERILIPLADSNDPAGTPMESSPVDEPPPVPPKINADIATPPILASRDSEPKPEQAPSTDKRRRRTFSLTSLLASKTHKSNDTPPPPVPSLPSTSTSSTEDRQRSRPRVRKQKSLKQMFFPPPSVDEQLPPIPPLPIIRRSESDPLKPEARSLDPSPVLSISPALPVRSGSIAIPTDDDRTSRPVSFGATPHAGPSRIIKRFSLSNMSGAFKKMASTASSRGDIPPVPGLPDVHRQSLMERDSDVTPRQAVSARHAEEDYGDRDRERTDSGFSSSTFESPTCQNLTSISPRTQRNPSASPALRGHVHQVSCSSEIVVESGAHQRHQSLEATIVLDPASYHETPLDEDETVARMNRDGSLDSIPSQTSHSRSDTETYESNGISSEDHRQLKTPIPSSTMTMDAMPFVELDRVDSNQSQYQDAQDRTPLKADTRDSSDSLQSFHSADQGISPPPKLNIDLPSIAIPPLTTKESAIRRLINPRQRFHSSPNPAPYRPTSHAEMGRKLEAAGHLKSLHFDDLGLDFEEFHSD